MAVCAPSSENFWIYSKMACCCAIIMHYFRTLMREAARLGGSGYNPGKLFRNFKCKILHSNTVHCSSTPEVGEAVADPAPPVPTPLVTNQLDRPLLVVTGPKFAKFLTDVADSSSMLAQQSVLRSVHPLSNNRNDNLKRKESNIGKT